MEESNPSHRRTPRFRFGNGRRSAGIWLIPVLISVSAGQAIEESSVAEPKPQPDEAVIELPPFQVRPPEGWVAQDTLAGTRLRTSYRDLASQIETLTPEFMEDFALGSVEEAMIYTTNVESPDEYVLPGSGVSDHIYSNLRIRGLSTVEPTRFFFRSLAPADSYNLNRIDISSGPNTILFGTRLNAGAINSEPGSAGFSNGGSLGAQFDTNGTFRFSLDYNRVLARDTFALRAAVLYENHEWDIQPSGELDRRFYAAATYMPWSKTRIRAFFENVDLERQVPTRALPFDALTPWYEAGGWPDSGYTENQPVFENTPDKRPTGDQQVFEGHHGRPLLVLANGSEGGYSEIRSWWNSAAVKDSSKWSGVNPLNSGRTPTLLDDRYFPTDVSLITGIRQNNATDKVANLFLNQEILPGLNLEAGGHVEGLDLLLAEDIGSTVSVDANRYLPDGVTQNPNVGRMYVEGTPHYYRLNEDVQSWRVALAYDHDFADKSDGWSRHLGRHRLVGLVSGEEFENKAFEYLYRVIPKNISGIEFEFPEIEGISWQYPFEIDADGNAFVTDPNAFFILKQPTLLSIRYYLDPDSGDVVPRLPFTAGQPIEIVDSNGKPFVIDPENTGFFDGRDRRLATGFHAGSYRANEDVAQFTYQGHLFGDRLVLTYGRRRTELQLTSLTDFGPDPYTGMVPHMEEVDYAELQSVEPGVTETTGVVVAPLRDWLELPGNMDFTVSYQKSTTYGTPTPYLDPFGISYPGSHGEGEDFSIRLSLPGNRFSVRLNHYKVTAGPTPASGKPFQQIKSPLKIVESRIRELDPNLPVIDGPSGRALGTVSQGNQYSVMAYVEASGYELTGDWAVTDSLNLRFNAANMETVESDVGNEWWQWIDQRLPVYQSLDVPEGGVNDPRDVDGDGTIGRWTWETAAHSEDSSQTLSDYWDTTVVHGQDGTDVIHSLEGKSNPFVRSLRFNVNGMYRFTQGNLNGLRLGAAVRWREAPLLAYGATQVDGSDIIDLDNPLYGVSEWYLDLVARYSFRTAWLGDRNTTVSLNVRNALDRDDPIPYELYVNGDPLRMANVEGIKFILSLGIEL